MNTHIFRLAVVVTLVVCLFSGAFFYSGCGTDKTETQVNFLVEEYLDNSFLSRIDPSISGAFSGIPLARAYHETQGYYELSFTKTAYDVDESSQWTTGELQDKIEPDNLHTWPNVINLTLLHDENAVLLNDLLAPLSEYDQNGLINSEVIPALRDGSRIFLARDFITTLVRDDKVYTEIPYFLFINLDMPKINAVLELQGFNPDAPFPDAPFIHDPHVEKLIQLLIQGSDLNGELWHMCLRGNEKIQKFQAVVVSKDGAGEFDIRLMTSTCEDCCLGYKYQFNPPLYPPKKGERIPVPELSDKFDPGRNPNINLNNKLGQPVIGLAQGDVPSLIDKNPIIPVPDDDTVIAPGEEQELESETADELSEDPCCQSWPYAKLSREEIDCHLGELEKLQKELEKLKNSFEYQKRSQHGMENMDPVVQQWLKLDEFDDPYLSVNLTIYYQEVLYGLAFDDQYKTMVLDELDKLISQCSGCSKSSSPIEIKVNKKPKTTKTASINCDCDCDAKDACLYKNPLENSDYTQRKECLEKSIDSLQNQINDMNKELVALHKQFPKMKLLFDRTTIWDNIFYDGVTGIDARAFCLSPSGPGIQDYGVAEFFHNVYLGIVANNQSVDEAIKNAITEDMRKSQKAAGLVECALTQLGKSLKTAYEKELKNRGYSEKDIEILLNKNLTPEEKQAVEQVEKLRKEIQLKDLLRNKILLALVNMDRKQSECAKKYMEKKQCELTVAMAMMEGFKQSVASGELNFDTGFKTDFAHCDFCKEIQRLACCHGGNPACTSACKNYPADCCTDFKFPCGFMKYLICFGKSALYAKEQDKEEAEEQGEDVLFCPEFEYNSDPSCANNTCVTNEVCEKCTKKVLPTTVPTVVPPGVAPPTTFTLPPTVISPPTETLPPTTQVLRADASANAESLRDQSGCRSTLTVSYNAQDLTGGSYPVVRVVLTVNGQPWHDSGTISTVNYQNAVSKEVGCGQTFNIQVTATNKNGQMVTVPGSITTPIP